MTSVFPSTTASAITTFGTGLAPIEHGVTGWHMFLREIGCIITPLRHTIRTQSIEIEETKADAVLGKRSFSEKLMELKGNRCYTIMPASIIDSVFSRQIRGNSIPKGYNTLRGMFSQIRSAVRQSRRSKKKNYIYSYWPELDHLAHLYGTSSVHTYSHLLEICEECMLLIEYLKGKDTLLIITADHGLIERDKIIDLRQHPQLKDCLTLPLCGEARMSYCYVRLAKKKQFEAYMKKNLIRYCTAYKTEDLLKRGWFGSPSRSSLHPEFFYRTGDYVIVMKKNHVMIDPLGCEDYARALYADHGGVSEDEMLVPLIVAG